MDFLELAKKRYSCRDMAKRSVEEEKIEKIIKAGILAPTAVNRQPVKIFRFESEEAIKVLHEATKFTFNAEHFLMVASDKKSAWTRPFDQKNFADIDAAIVATQMMLEIEDLGLSTTWVGYFDAPLLKKHFPKLKDYELIAIFPIGYKGEKGEASERHEHRKSEEEMLELL